ncbi:helix-turn-helix domain-containing protein [Sediminicoccus rosea]|uniref:DUF4115 domain-containing protein n=1 Tax=Sediminicoccus rosea TaxID=1225128 RepID=A0ABZ0PFB0_9PROT|nr:RodZ domain-containing protein [Sediminicoccus rosea]WPB84157.1 DUF4115 domain-containing protein [Sediminicoccus rosea]
MKRFRPQEAQTVDAARLGEELRDARLALGLSIEDVAAELRIRRVYLIALEEGRLKDLPSPAYAVGFVRNYAGALGLDPSEMVRRLRDAVATGARKTDLVFPEPVPERGFPAGVLVLAGAVIAIGAYVAWYNWAGTGNRTVDAVPPVPARLEPAARTGEALRPATPAPTAPSTTATAPTPAASPAPSATPSPTPPGAAVIVPALPVPTPVPVQVPTPAPPPAAAPPADQPRITLRARAEIWTQVRDTRANQTLISRNMRPGETFVVPNREGLLLSVGNAAMIEVLVDGQPSPAFGNTPGVRRDVPLVPDQLRPRPAAGTQAPAAPAAAPPAPARLNPPAQRQ